MWRDPKQHVRTAIEVYSNGPPEPRSMESTSKDNHHTKGGAPTVLKSSKSRPWCGSPSVYPPAWKAKVVWETHGPASAYAGTAIPNPASPW